MTMAICSQIPESSDGTSLVTIRVQLSSVRRNSHARISIRAGRSRRLVLSS